MGTASDGHPGLMSWTPLSTHLVPKVNYRNMASNNKKTACWDESAFVRQSHMMLPFLSRGLFFLRSGKAVKPLFKKRSC